MVLILLAASLSSAQSKRTAEIRVPGGYSPPPLTRDASLQDALSKAVNGALKAFEKDGFRSDEVAATVIDLSDPQQWKTAEVRGEARIYSASVVKMYYMAALERQLEDKRLTSTPEMERGLRDMIVDSSNEATQYILDVITGTSSGAELPQKEFDAWQYKRNKVNRWFTALGYTNINVNQKTFCEDAYGIEQQSRGYKGNNRNMLTTNATARLLAEIVTGRLNTQERTQKMMALMKRDPWGKAVDADDQNNGFTGKLFIDRNMRDVRLWSKAGWTSKTRHDAAYVVTGSGLKFVIVVFTENHATVRDFIPTVAGNVLDALKR